VSARRLPSTALQLPSHRVAGVNGGVAHFGFRLADSTALDSAIAQVEAAGGRLIRRGEPFVHLPEAQRTEVDVPNAVAHLLEASTARRGRG
jgi:hypothetical protein